MNKNAEERSLKIKKYLGVIDVLEQLNSSYFTPEDITYKAPPPYTLYVCARHRVMERKNSFAQKSHTQQKKN